MTRHTPEPPREAMAEEVPHGGTFRTGETSYWMRLSAQAEKKIRKMAGALKDDRVFAISLGNGHLLDMMPDRVIEIVDVVYLPVHDS